MQHTCVALLQVLMPHSIVPVEPPPEVPFALPEED
jgi:hypothetical protein